MEVKHQLDVCHATGQSHIETSIRTKNFVIFSIFRLQIIKLFLFQPELLQIKIPLLQ